VTQVKLRAIRNLPAKLRGLRETYDGSIACGAWSTAMAREQVLEHRVEAAVFRAVELRILVKGEVPGAPNSFQHPQHGDRLALQGLEFLAHGFRSDGRGFYGQSGAKQRYFRTLLWISCSPTVQDALTSGRRSHR
jgi:hypothetical protein